MMWLEKEKTSTFFSEVMNPVAFQQKIEAPIAHLVCHCPKAWSEALTFELQIAQVGTDRKFIGANPILCLSHHKRLGFDMSVKTTVLHNELDLPPAARI